MATRWAIRVALPGWLVLVSLVLLLGNPTLVRHWNESPQDAFGLRFASSVLSYPMWGLPGSRRGRPADGQLIDSILTAGGVRAGVPARH